MPSAPEFADYLVACSHLSPEEKQRLVFLWLDRCIRAHAAAALERCGHAASAERLRHLDEIRDESQLQVALQEFGSVIGPPRQGAPRAPDTTDVDACYFCLAGNLPRDRSESGFDFASVIVTVLTAARCVGAVDEERDMRADAGATRGPLH